MHPTAVALIEPQALRHNAQLLHHHTGKPLLAVLKANAYGHGIPLIAPLLEPLPEVWGYAVASGPEAQQVRQSGCQKPILLLSPPDARDIPELHRLGVRFTLSHQEELSLLPAGAQVHLKINTGLNRLGARPEEVSDLLDALQAHNVHLEGCFAHFAFADQQDLIRARHEWHLFKQVIPLLPAQTLKHMGASEGVLALGQDTAFDLIRPGMALFGNVCAGHLRGKLPLKPVMTLKARICHLHEVRPGETVSYEGRWQATHPTRVAVVQIGYADGYPIQAAGKSCVVVQGEKRPTLGLFGMDQLMVDVTGLSVQVGDWVELFNATTLTADQVSDWGNTISSQMLSCLGSRIQRIVTAET
ncbi:alanine racemase [Deinococcus misasensis]|uniref:alanine racemase n=1 Tax=Deinococcus misasensis TaxID=392413 RepID=UPI00054D431D|nr:alanine racemase [Deinococcus misasensis]